MARISFNGVRLLYKFTNIFEGLSGSFIAIEYERWYSKDVGTYDIKVYGSERVVDENEARRLNEEKLEKIIKEKKK